MCEDSPVTDCDDRIASRLVVAMTGLPFPRAAGRLTGHPYRKRVMFRAIRTCGSISMNFRILYRATAGRKRLSRHTKRRKTTVAMSPPTDWDRPHEAACLTLR